jgi:hypothetical protein
VTEEEIKIWCAGMLDASGILASTIERGPTGKEYHALTLCVAAASPQHASRLTLAANNGAVTEEYPMVWQLGGPAAIKGFLAEVWPYLSSAKKSEVNGELRKFKQLAS